MVTLENAEEKNRNYPDTYHIPELKDRKNLKRGDFAKLSFVSDDGRERMWVKVTSCKNGICAGTLANNPVNVDLKYGQRILFSRKNIIDIMTAEKKAQIGPTIATPIIWVCNHCHQMHDELELSDIRD